VPFTAKLMVPLYEGILNLSAGLKVMLVCACALGQVQGKIKTMTIMTIPAETLLQLIVTKPHCLHHCK